MSNDLDKQIEAIDKQIEGQRKQIAFDKNRGKSTMQNVGRINELSKTRENLLKFGDSQQEIIEIRVKINENTQTVEKLTQRNQILKHGRETYNKMQTEFVESAKNLLASLKL